MKKVIFIAAIMIQGMVWGNDDKTTTLDNGSFADYVCPAFECHIAEKFRECVAGKFKMFNLKTDMGNVKNFTNFAHDIFQFMRVGQFIEQFKKENDKCVKSYQETLEIINDKEVGINLKPDDIIAEMLVHHHCKADDCQKPEGAKKCLMALLGIEHILFRALNAVHHKLTAGLTFRDTTPELFKRLVNMMFFNIGVNKSLYNYAADGTHHLIQRCALLKTPAKDGTKESPPMEQAVNNLYEEFNELRSNLYDYKKHAEEEAKLRHAILTAKKTPAAAPSPKTAIEMAEENPAKRSTQDDINISKNTQEKLRKEKEDRNKKRAKEAP